jgi:UDP-2-acetamido-2-deoxy-ribo-hexuluronate aminotransferase
MQFIDLQAQYQELKLKIDARIQSVLDHGRFIMGPEVSELEKKLADFVGVKHCISVANGSDALQIAMMALEIGPGDEVITTPFSFIATAEMIALLGAKPVFVDIDAKTYNLDPEQIESAITPKTKAIMPVSLYGQCADMEGINTIAQKHGLAVIEDAAQSFGATYHGKRSCGLSTIGCTSFFPSKPLGCYGDGGACFTDDDGLATRMKQLHLHGQDRRYHHPMIGVNSRLDTLQAAILLEKLEVFPSEIEARQRVAAHYERMLKDYCETPSIANGCTSVHGQYTVSVKNRAEIVEHFKSQSIPTAVHYPIPLNLQPAFAYLRKERGSFPIADACSDSVMSLPMHPYLKESEQQRIAECFASCCVNVG